MAIHHSSGGWPALRRPDRSWSEAAVILVSVVLCVVAGAWTVNRGAADRRQAMDRQNGAALALAGLAAQVVHEQLGDGAGGVRLGEDARCAFCVAVYPAGAAARVVDLRPRLVSVARSAGPGAVVGLAGDDGAWRALGAEGTELSGRFARAGVPDGKVLDGVPRAVGMAPLGAGLRLLVGLDMATPLLVAQGRYWRDWLLAGLTCGLLLGLCGVSVRGLRRSATRRARLARDREALTLLNTELKAAHRRLRTQNADLEATFGALPDGISYYDRQFQLVRWNQNVSRVTGVPAGVMRTGVSMEEVLRSQLRAGEFGEFADEEAGEAEIRRRLSTLRTHAPLRVVERTRPNGQVLELRRTSLADGGFVTIYTDVTSRKQMAAAQEAAHEAARRAAEHTAGERARFAAIVSHEIRNPVAVILNALGLMNRSGLPPDQLALVQAGMEAGEALLALLNDILDLSRLEAGSLPVVSAPFAPALLVAGVADMFRVLARQRGLELAVSIGADVPDRVTADAARVRQVLMNLVGNAVKFAAPGTVTLGVSTVDAVPGEAGRLLRFAVCDAGPVIPDAERVRLFRPFSQLGHAAQGTGLGLSICALLARRLGGEAAVQDVAGPDGVGVGNEFFVTLPLQPAPVMAAGVPGPERPLARRPPRTHILVVEDSGASRALLTTVLRRDGHHVEAVANGADALALLANAPFDLVLTDVGLPRLDGMQLTRRLRSLPGPAGRVPVVGVTADPSPATRATCLAAGMTDVLAKPAGEAVLREVINRRVWMLGGSGEGRAEPGSAPVVWDRTRLRGFANAPALLDLCLDEISAQVPVLEEAAVAGRGEAVATVAHAAAGAAANHGFDALALSLGRLIEGQVAGAAVPLLAQVATELRRVRAEAEASRLGGGEDDVVGATGIEPVTLRV